MATENCSLPASRVADIFLAAPPMLAQQILDLTAQHPSFLRDAFEMAPWPNSGGNILEQLVYKGAMPQIERGFQKWKKHPYNVGCDPCIGPDCGYNWTEFGGQGFSKKVTELMSREFRSPEYCVKEIQTTFQVKEVFAKVVENLYRQVDFFKEQNIALNFLTSLAKKFVVDSTGARPNTADPYSYPNIGAARLSTLGINMLEFFYEWMRRMPDAVPYDVVNGSPIYSLMCSHQLLSRLYRDDGNLRQDVRFSGAANDMLMKYNFMSTIRGMFIAAPILTPRRFNMVNGVPFEVLPYTNDIPMDIGAYTGFNPAYEAATHEEVIIMGKYPFKIFYQQTEQSLGENSSFGPEAAFFNTWQWVNPQTVQDPFRRVGYYATAASIGLSQQFSEGILAILVERPKTNQMAVFLPTPVCPVADPVCNNAIPNTGCPCPIVLMQVQDDFVANTYVLKFAVPVTGNVGGSVALTLSNGDIITGTIAAISSDGYTVKLTFSGATVPLPDCDRFVSVECVDKRACTASVEAVTATGTSVTLFLQQAILANVGQVVTIVYGDGTTASVTITAIDPTTNAYTTTTINHDSIGDIGVLQVCVPSTTNAACVGCGGTTLTQCHS